ncbi:hypothetical protein WDW37_04980 [Bdellovibrionota bacterium FG-1]
MNSTNKVLLISGLAFFGSAITQQASAFPVDPAKVPVTGVDLSRLRTGYTLAYDSNDKSVVYYSPKSGRLASFNGLPSIGFARVPNGKGYLQAQFEFEISPEDRGNLLEAIRAGGYTPVPFPYNKTTVKPLIQGYDPESGQRTCQEVTDLSTGLTSKVCDQSIYDILTYVRNGPTLGENIAVSAQLSPDGADMFGNLLRGGNAFQVALEAEYYTAGDAFTAEVEVNYSRLFQEFSVAASAKGWFTSAEAEGIWRREGLCYGKPADQCAVRVHLTDGRGRAIDNLSIDKDNPAADLVWQAVERLKQKLEDDMLTPITPVYGQAKTSDGLGFHVSAKYQNLRREMHGVFQFKSPRAVNVKKTTIVATAACISVSPTGVITKETAGACQNYWNGGDDMTNILNRLARGRY